MAPPLSAHEHVSIPEEALCREALRTGKRLLVPAGVVGQVWRDPVRQVPLRALLASVATVVPALDQVLAEAAGVLCGRAGTSDVVDASVVLTARRARAVIVTSDMGDLRRLDPNISLERI